jgi:hypothetical protein
MVQVKKNLWDQFYKEKNQRDRSLNMAMLSDFNGIQDRQQSTTEIKLYPGVLLSIILLLRLVPRDFWLLCLTKMSIAMVGGMRNHFVFVV